MKLLRPAKETNLLCKVVIETNCGINKDPKINTIVAEEYQRRSKYVK